MSTSNGGFVIGYPPQITSLLQGIAREFLGFERAARDCGMTGRTPLHGSSPAMAMWRLHLLNDTVVVNNLPWKRLQEARAIPKPDEQEWGLLLTQLEHTVISILSELRWPKGIDLGTPYHHYLGSQLINECLGGEAGIDASRRTKPKIIRWAKVPIFGRCTLATMSALKRGFGKLMPDTGELMAGEPVDKKSSKPERKQPKKPSGRRRGTPKEDDRIASAWNTNFYPSYADLAKELGITKRAVELAIDRVRKRQGVKSL